MIMIWEDEQLSKKKQRADDPSTPSFNVCHWTVDNLKRIRVVRS